MTDTLGELACSPAAGGRSGGEETDVALPRGDARVVTWSRLRRGGPASNPEEQVKAGEGIGDHRREERELAGDVCAPR